MKSNLDFIHQSLTELNRFDISHYPLCELTLDY